LNIAFTCARPVVASRVGAIAEALTDGREGLLVPPGDPEALARAMIDVLANRQMAQKMGAAGRAAAEGPLKWCGEIAEKTRAVYHRAISSRNRGTIKGNLCAWDRWLRIQRNFQRQTSKL
jgi:glycosyltransferase involved in cell wall biosynthesis